MFVSFLKTVFSSISRVLFIVDLCTVSDGIFKQRKISAFITKVKLSILFPKKVISLYADSNSENRIILTSILKKDIKTFNYNFDKLKKVITSIKKSTWTKCACIYVLHTCTKFQQPRGNNRKLQALLLTKKKIF